MYDKWDKYIIKNLDLSKWFKKLVEDLSFREKYGDIFSKIKITEKKEAKIHFIITDQGTGGAFCSGCDKCLDKMGECLPLICPFCGATFVGTDTYTNMGGSDF